MVVPCHFHAPSHSYKYKASDTLPRTNKKHYKNYSKEKKTLQKQNRGNITKKEKKKEKEDLEIRCPQPTKGYQHFHPSQSSHSANISTPRATDHTSLIGKGLQNQNCTFMTFKYTLHMYSCYY